MFVLSVKENVYSPRRLQEYLNNSTDSLNASVFISSKVTGLIDNAGKGSWHLEVPPGRARRDAYIMSAFLCASGGKKEGESLREQSGRVIKCVFYIYFPGRNGVFQESTVHVEYILHCQHSAGLLVQAHAGTC